MRGPTLKTGQGSALDVKTKSVHFDKKEIRVASAAQPKRGEMERKTPDLLKSSLKQSSINIPAAESESEMVRPASNLDKLSNKVINFLNAQHPGRYYNL